jgi:RHS repeat-associated protein
MKDTNSNPTNYNSGNWEFSFYGIDGQRVATLFCGTSSCGLQPDIRFGNRLLQSRGSLAVTNRLGSVRWSLSSGPIAYYPWGEERTSTSDDADKFGTYFRDAPGQDYARARYYNSNGGRFWSPDRNGLRTADPRNPTSWNRYAYANGDPVNFNDPHGKVACTVEEDEDCPADPDPDPTDQGGGGYATSVLISYPSSCTQGEVLTSDGNCADPDAASLQQIANGVYVPLSGLTQPSTWLAAGVASTVAASGGLLVSALLTGTSSTTATVLNVGGEGEVPGAYNFQGPWVLLDGYANATTSQTLGEMQAAGNQFVIGSNTSMPFATGTFQTVVTNGVPLDTVTWLGPSPRTSEICRVLAAGGTWYHNGAPTPCD